MPIAYTRRKIEHLRKQPEHVRLRAASLMTIGSGVVLVIVWLTILLPLQLHLTAPKEDTTARPLLQAQASLSPAPTNSAVSGARDLVLPTSALGSLPTATPYATILPSPTPTTVVPIP